jgi:hypothetical protein
VRQERSCPILLAALELMPEISPLRSKPSLNRAIFGAVFYGQVVVNFRSPVVVLSHKGVTCCQIVFWNSRMLTIRQSFRKEFVALQP